MNQWPFVYAVYTIGIIGTAGLIAYCWAGLKRVEKRLDDIKRK